MRLRQIIGLHILSGLSGFVPAFAGAQAVAATLEVADRAMPITVPAQPIETALNEFARQSGIHVVIDSGIATNVVSTGVKGEFRTEEALTLLLKSTGLTYRVLDGQTISVERVAERKSSREGRETGVRLAQADTSSAESGSSGSGQGTEGKQGTSDSPENSEGAKLEEIVVTAEKREESIQNLPISIMAFSGETLENRGIDDIFSLQQIAPSLVAAPDQGHIAKISIRGIGQTFLGLSAEAGAAIIEDGFPHGSALTGGVDFFDVERVEVLRGPQGTISGRNATAGAIHLHSARPTEDLEGRVEATIGNYDRLAVEGYLSGPIVEDRLLARLAVRSDRADGWVTNTTLNEELGSIDKMQARASFLARLSDNFEAHLVLEGLRDRSQKFLVENGRGRPDMPSLAEFSGSRSFDWDRGLVEHDQPNDFDIEKDRVTLNLAWDLGPSARLTAITGYLDYSARVTRELDGTTLPVLVRHPDGEIYEASQVSQEITLAADLTDRLDVIIGGLYMDVEQAGGGTATGGGPIGLPLLGIPLSLGGIDNLQDDNELTSLAAYTQWRYRLTDVIRLTAGVRYTHDSKDFTSQIAFLGTPGPVLDVDDSWSAWTPRVAVEYTPGENATLYASVSRGFKSGGFDGTGIAFLPEFVWNYEAGLKANWLDGRMKTALTGFYMNYTDLQQNLLVFEPGQPLTARTVNANSATIRGVELELDALVTDQFRVTVSGTWLDATFDELFDQDTLFPELGAPFPGAPPGSPNVRDFSGNRLERSPEWQFNVSGEYRVPLGAAFRNADLQGVLRATYAWQDKVYFDFYNHEGASQDAYGLVNLSGAIEPGDGRWELSAYVRNLTNEEYIGGTSVAVGLTPVPLTHAQLGWPRTYGVSVSYRFGAH